MTAGLTRQDLLHIFESAADGVYAVDVQQWIVFWNRAAAKLLGFRAGEVVGRQRCEVIAGGDYQGHLFCRHGCPIIEAAKRGRAVQNFDLCCRRADGNIIWLNFTVLSMHDPEGEGRLVVNLFRDVTRRRRAEILAQETIDAVARYRPREEEAKAEAVRLYPAPVPRLTRRELDVLRLLTAGTSVSVIAQPLGIKGITVSNHIEHILSKLGVHSRLEAVVYAAQQGLV